MTSAEVVTIIWVVWMLRQSLDSPIAYSFCLSRQGRKLMARTPCWQVLMSIQKLECNHGVAGKRLPRSFSRMSAKKPKLVVSGTMLKRWNRIVSTASASRKVLTGPKVVRMGLPRPEKRFNAMTATTNFVICWLARSSLD